MPSCGTFNFRLPIRVRVGVGVGVARTGIGTGIRSRTIAAVLSRDVYVRIVAARTIVLA